VEIFIALMSISSLSRSSTELLRRHTYLHRRFRPVPGNLELANTGGAGQPPQKYVEVDLRKRGTPLHAATVIGDTSGDPFKTYHGELKTPIISSRRCFGLLAGKSGRRR